MKELRKRKGRLTGTTPNSTEARSRAEARGRAVAPPDSGPRCDPVFVSKEAVLQKREFDFQRATYDGREFIRQSGETVEQFRDRVNASIPTRPAKLVCWHVS